MALWFKLYHELLRDKKLRMMAAELEMPGAFVRGLWIDLLCFAHELDHDWHLQIDDDMPLTDSLIIDELGADKQTSERFLEAARKYRLVEDEDGCMVVTSGEERNQKPSDSPEAWRDRKAKSRASHAGREKKSRRDVTRQRREEERRKEENAREEVVVDNSTSTTSSRYCETCGAELRSNGDGTASVHCPTCEPEAVA